MNVLIVSETYIPAIGGVERVVDNLSRELVREGHSVCIITSNRARDGKSLDDFEVNDAGIEIHRLNFEAPYYGPRSFLKFCFFFPRGMLRMIRIVRKRHIDLMNLHYVGAATIYALLLRFLFRLPLVTTLHGPAVRKGFSESAIRAWIARKCLETSNFVTTNSNALLEEVIEFCPQIRERSFATRIGVNLEEFENTNAFPNSSPYILAIGRFTHVKGFDILIKAFHTLNLEKPDVDLVIVGDGSEIGRCQELAHNLSIKEKITFWGAADRKEVVQLLNGCEFLVVPSRQESFGLVSLEAMAAGKAVVATNVRGVSEVVRDGENGLLVEPENPDAFSKAMLLLLEDSNFRGHMGSRGRKLVEECYSWGRVVSEYVEAYEKAIIGRGA